MFNLTNARGILKSVTTTMLLTSTLIISGFSEAEKEEAITAEVQPPVYEIPYNVISDDVLLPAFEISITQGIQYLELTELTYVVNNYSNESSIKGIYTEGSILIAKSYLSNGFYELLDGGYIGEEKIKVREDLGKKAFVKVTADSLNLRAEPSARAKKLGFLVKGDLRTVVEILDNGWLKLSDGSFVNGKYTERLNILKPEFDKLVTQRKAEIRAKAEAERKAKEAAALKAKQQAVAAKATQNTTAKTTQTVSAPTTHVSNRYAAISLSNADRELLARLIYCEANVEPFEGQVGVAQVVFNRVLDNRFPNSVEGVIKAKGQFVPVSSGKINKVKPTSENYKAVDEALASGGLNGAVYFHNPKYSGGSWWSSLTTVASIGSHAFKK